LLLISCRRNVTLPETVEAHYLKYDIHYLEDRAGDIPTRILPGHMDAYYTKYYVLSRIEGFFNQFSLIQIADLRHRQVSTLLNFFGNKVYCVGRPGELPAAIRGTDKIQSKYTGETKIIGGLNSERVEVNTGEEEYSIYVTHDFSIRRPNITTPYYSINQPLSQFKVQLSVLKMLLSCSEFEQKFIESEIFTIPEEYRPVTRENMEEIINSLFTKE
jgi:hypothetical protein